MPIGILEKVVRMHLLGLHEDVLNTKDIDFSLFEVAHDFLFSREDLFNLC